MVIIVFVMVTWNVKGLKAASGMFKVSIKDIKNPTLVFLNY